MCPIYSPFRPAPSRRRGTDRGRRLSRWYVLAGLCLTFALLRGLTGVADPVDAASTATTTLPPAPTGLTPVAAVVPGHSR